MTVKELIEFLKTCPQDYDVKSFDNQGFIGGVESQEIEIDDEFFTIVEWASIAEIEEERYSFWQHEGGLI